MINVFPESLRRNACFLGGESIGKFKNSKETRIN